LKKSWWLLLAISVLLTLAIPLVLGGLAQFRMLHRLNWWVAISLAMLAIISWVFNALRTQMLMASLGARISFLEAALTTISAEFAGVTTPGSVGMAATYTFLYHNLGVTLGEAVGLVGVIMVTDLIYFGTIMPLAAIIQLFEGTSRQTPLPLVAVIMVVVVGSALVLGVLIRNYRRVYRFVSRQMARFSWLAKRRFRLARGAVHLIRAMRALRRMPRWHLLALYFITLGFWLPRYLVLILVIHLVAHSNAPFSYLLLVQGVLNLGGQIFLMPGGGGTVDAGYAAFLSPFLTRQALAFTLLVWRTYTFYLLLIVGGPIFLLKTGKAARDLLTRKASQAL
jgi:glycosyltransferase 2 family protein